MMYKGQVFSFFEAEITTVRRELIQEHNGLAFNRHRDSELELYSQL